jgi:hypothetical protein
MQGRGPGETEHFGDGPVHPLGFLNQQLRRILLLAARRNELVFSSNASPLMELNGLRTSWATPPAILPTAANRSFSRIRCSSDLISGDIGNQQNLTHILLLTVNDGQRMTQQFASA